MPMSAVLNWFARPTRLLEDEALHPSDIEPNFAVEAELAPVVSRPSPLWTLDRLAVTDALWGEGYQFPGGELEAVRLAKPMGLTAAASLLLLGAGSGGPACSVATQLGAWVSGFEADPNLAAVAIDRIARRNLSKRAQIETWNPTQPTFRQHFYHHGLALEALHGGQPERTLAAIASALKPGGQLMMVELVADSPLDQSNPVVATWARLERRDPGALPKQDTITRILGRLGFDVRVVEDVSQRHIQHALSGWRAEVREMEDNHPSRRRIMRYVQEAELWLVRLRLFQPGWLRLVRWHAIGGG
ncbi:MAG: methyltransferase domain-containing protein [Acetobacteraceae bacterium]|jgi:cyclopropane fatty-acyl-phospholipid synthase-like methyltransferase